MEGDELVDDYVIAEIWMRRISAGGHVEDGGAGFDFSGSFHATTTVIPFAGTTWQIGSNYSYFEDEQRRENGETITARERKEIHTGFIGFLTYDRVSWQTCKVYGKVEVSSLLSGLDTSTTALPVHVTVRGKQPAFLCRIVVGTAALAADIQNMTGKAVVSGDALQLWIRMR